MPEPWAQVTFLYSIQSNHLKQIEKSLRYMFCPPLANERLEILPGGDVLLRLKITPGGTTHLCFMPAANLEQSIAKLVALIPKRRSHLVCCHGVFAPNAWLREIVVVKAPKFKSGEGSEQVQRLH